MMKKHRRIALLATAAFVIVVAAVFGVLLGGGRAESASVDLTVKSALEAQGLRVTSVAQDSATDTLNVVINSKTDGSPDDAWASTIIQREADFLAESGALPVAWVGVTVVDEQGKVTYEWSGPVSSRPRPVEKAASPTAVEAAKSDLAGQAEKQGVTLRDLSVSSDKTQGTVVKAEEIISSPAGDARDNEIKWATTELLGQLRDRFDASDSIAVDLYRISIKDAAGIPLVEYVVDPGARTVRAWMAPGITPVWSSRGSSPAPVPGKSADIKAGDS
jgi:hypothetical protein